MPIPARRSLILVILLCLGVASSAAAQPAKAKQDPKPDSKPKLSVLDLIPIDACGVLAVRNLKELKERGDTLFEKVGPQGGIRPSQLVPMVYQWLGITRGIDENAPAAVMVMRYPKPESHLVLAVSFDDRNAMAANFGLKGTDLVEGKVVQRKSKQVQRGWPIKFANFVTVRDNHIVCGATAKAVNMMLKAKTLKSKLTKEQQQVFEKSDLIGHVSVTGMGEGWVEAVDEITKYLLKVTSDEDPRVAAGLIEAVKRMETATFSARLDDGVGAHALLRFADEKPVRFVLSSLAGKGSGARFDALPTEGLISTYGVSGAGELRVEMLRGTLIAALKQFGPARQLVSAVKLPDIVNVLGEITHSTQSRRVAVYHNKENTQDGLLSIVAVLDTNDADKFRTDMQELAKYVSYATLKPDDDRRPKIKAETIDTLITQLGDRSFRKRNSAMTKLLLIGDAAMPALKKSEMSTDAEVANRSKRLRKSINAKIEARRKGLLDQDLIGRLNPRFGYHVAAEKRGGRAIDIVRVELKETQGDFKDSMNRFLGPQWKSVRLATVGKQVVVLIGSNLTVFDQTLKNLEQKTPALAKHPNLKLANARHDPAGQFTIHFSIERLLTLVFPEKSRQFLPKTGKNELTSCTLRIAPTSIRVDMFIPYREIKVAMQTQNLAKP